MTAMDWPPRKGERAGTADLAVILVNYNGAKDTITACASLEAATYRDWSVLVVDNASADESVAVLRRAIRRGALLESAVNLGFAGGCNLAFRTAIAEGRDYVLLLNNDATVAPDAIARLVATSKSLHDGAILGCAVKFAGTDKYQFIGSAPRRDVGLPLWFDTANAGELLGQALIESDFIYGAAMFIPVPVLLRVGPFREDFFLNYEETDFCYRARRLGIPSYVHPEAIAYHRSGGSLGVYEGPLQSYFLTRNELLFAERHASAVQRLRLLGRRGRAIARAWRARLREKRSFTPSERAMMRGFQDYVARRFGDCPAVIRQLAAAAPRLDQASLHRA